MLTVHFMSLLVECDDDIWRIDLVQVSKLSTLVKCPGQLVAPHGLQEWLESLCRKAYWYCAAKRYFRAGGDSNKAHTAPGIVGLMSGQWVRTENTISTPQLNRVGNGDLPSVFRQGNRLSIEGR